MRFLVTGATGFLGQHLVHRLLEREGEIALLVREIYGMGEPLPPPLQSNRHRLRLVYADLRNLTLTRRAVAEARPSIVLHLAAAGVTNPFLPVEQAIRHNVTGTINLLRAAFEQSVEVQRLVVARTPGEERPSNAYQASKAAAWRFCQMYANQMSWPINGAKIFQAYGPNQPRNTFIRSAFAAALRGDDFAMTSGVQERDWIYVDDVISGLLALPLSDVQPGIHVDLGTGSATPLLNVVQRIYDLVGRGGRPLPGALSDRPGEKRVQIANAETTHALIQWKAETSVDDGLQKLLLANLASDNQAG